MKRACPLCKKEIPDGERPPSLPLCSDRCRLLDLGGWLEGRYRIPAESQDGESSERESDE